MGHIGLKWFRIVHKIKQTAKPGTHWTFGVTEAERFEIAFVLVKGEMTMWMKQIKLTQKSPDEHRIMSEKHFFSPIYVRRVCLCVHIHLWALCQSV